MAGKIPENFELAAMNFLVFSRRARRPLRHRGGPDSFFGIRHRRIL